MKQSGIASVVAIALATVLVAAGTAGAGMKAQMSLVPNAVGATPGFAPSGSSVFIDGHRMLKGKIKKVVDGAGALVTTDGIPSVDDYSVGRSTSYAPVESDGADRAAALIAEVL